MINRRILPWRTAISFAAMTSRCQFIASLACGLRSGKQRATKVAKSSRSTNAYSAKVRSLLIELSLLAQEPSFELLNDLFVRRGEGVGLSRSRLSLAFDVAQKIEDDLDCAQIRSGRAMVRARSVPAASCPPTPSIVCRPVN